MRIRKQIFGILISAVFLSSCGAKNIEQIPTGTLYKDAIIAEIPTTWSYIRNAEFSLAKDRWRLGQNIAMSISASKISYQDGNGKQIDLYGMAGKDVNKFVEKLKEMTKENAGAWSQKLVNGKWADVHTPPKDFDSKGGGQTYFLAWNDPRYPTVDFGLIIDRQSIGNAELENGFAHFLKTLDLDKYAENSLSSYSVPL